MNAQTPRAFAQSSFASDAGGWISLPPDFVVQASTLAEVVPALAEVERRVEEDGLTAIGFVSFEAAPAFDPALAAHTPSGAAPLVWFGLAKEIGTESPDRALTGWAGAEAVGEADFQPRLDRAAHRAALAEIRARIAAGDTYQVNFTFPLDARGPAALAALPRLMRAQPTRRAAAVITPDWAVASASPELFYRLDDRAITMRPMKGTRPRGRHPAEDAALRAELTASPKDRAENVMIVDMVRNDLGRICRTGSVRTRDLFAAERYPTVWQMTSTVEGETGAGLVELFRALFPCASVTGAPKVSTMRIIRALEGCARGVYTGAMGVLRPGRRHEFNVAIRTLAAARAPAAAVYGAGSGVVWDSDPDREYDESLHKAAVLRDAGTRPDLLETLRWTPGEGTWLREGHLRRLAASADFLGYADPLPSALAAMDGLKGDTPLRVRLTVAPTGRAALTTTPLPPAGPPLRVRVDDRPLDSRQRRLFHKTTDRSIYEQARARHPDVDDVLLVNERGELTESTIANLAVRIDGIWWTPPLDCGLLPGVYREARLAAGELRERVLVPSDLRAAEEWHLFNSVRGIIPATRVP